MSTQCIPRQAPNTSSLQSVAQSLFNQLLALGEKLRDADPELYKTAVAHLHANEPREPSPVRRAAGAEQKGLQGDHARRPTTFHKYNLPGDAGKREYYQCMECSERRTTNSFHADHQHKGKKLMVRWYCPLCDTLYAVTHRGYHIKNRHKSAGSEKKPDERRIKTGSSSEEDFPSEGEDDSSPAVKRSRSDDETSQGSDDAHARDLVTISKSPQAIIEPPPPPPPQPDMSAFIRAQPANPPTDGITHTVTQEALTGGIMIGQAG